jgi:hypothetical protein
VTLPRWHSWQSLHHQDTSAAQPCHTKNGSLSSYVWL